MHWEQPLKVDAESVREAMSMAVLVEQRTALEASRKWVDVREREHPVYPPSTLTKTKIY